MRIALFAPYDLAVHGGIASHIRAQARALGALGHSVSVFGPASAPLGNGERALAASTTLRFGGTASGAALSPAVFRRVQRLFAGEAFDVVHVHEPLMPLLPWAAVMSARAPVVATFHVYREHGHRWYPLARPLLARVVNRIAARVAVSEAARRTVARHFPGEYHVVPNGIEPCRFQTAAARPSALPSGTIVLCVGRLERRKGIDTLIAAMARLHDRAADATLVVVGDGPDLDDLRATARLHEVRTTFLCDVSDEALPAFYRACDVFCAPALGGESFGIVLVEALAAGKRVVASRIDGYVDAVGESPCVHWAEAGNAESLARALLAALQNRDGFSADEAVRVASQYDWKNIAARLETIYQGVLHT